MYSKSKPKTIPNQIVVQPSVNNQLNQQNTPSQSKLNQQQGSFNYVQPVLTDGPTGTSNQRV